MSQRNVIVGAGPVGRNVAAILTAAGEEVSLISRSGQPSGIPGVRDVALDASNEEALARYTKGAFALYNCANPATYLLWEEVWPRLASSMLSAVESAGAIYAVVEGLYSYGPVDGPIHEGLPEAATDHKGILRAKLWSDALAAHDAGRIRAVQVRGSDYIGPGVGLNGHITRPLPDAIRGKSVSLIGRLDVPHTFTDVRDVARTVVAAARDEATYGRVWHVPSNPALTQIKALNDLLSAAGSPTVEIRGVLPEKIRAEGPVSPIMEEVLEVAYQWTGPWVLDDSSARRQFDIEPTPWIDVCRDTVEDLVAQGRLT